MTRRILAVLGFLVAAACPQSIFDPLPLPDAGDEAFVRRLVPVMWGRGPGSIREVDALVQYLQQTDRASLVETMAQSDEYAERWTEFMMDTLFVNRTGERGNPACYGVPQLDEITPDLAAWVRDHDPRDAPFTPAWSMADLFRSSIALDDLSPIFRANLFTVMAKDIPLQGEDAAKIVRQNLFDIFAQTYLNRQMMCMPCHNATGAVTDSGDPELDRHWPVPGLADEAIWGESEGRPIEDVVTLFRKHRVLSGYNIFNQQYDRRPTGCFGDNEPGCEGCACEEYVCAQDPSCCETTWGPNCVTLCQQADVGCVPGVPPGFDGCSALYGHPGCGECGCEQRVCDAFPSCCQISWTEFCAERCRLWYPEDCEIPGGYDYDLVPEPGAVSPWGIYYKCGLFNPPENVGMDPISDYTYFLGEHGADVSIWDVEAPLHRGFDKLRDGVDIDADGGMDGEEAFAWLVAQRVGDVVWKEVFGEPLTIANHFPRNEWQMAELERLTRGFVDGGFSLVDVLTEVALHPDFNAAAPADLDPTDPDVSPYALPERYNPWVKDHEIEELRNNSVGDIVHRRGPRYLARSITRALGFPDWPGFPAEPDAGPEGRLQEQLGFFLKDSAQGFPGNDFQGLTAYEYAFGACAAEPERADGCTPRSEPGCDGCACEFAVCVAEPECCSVRWDARCTGWCGDAGVGCEAAPDAPAPQPQWLERLAQQVRESSQDWTVEDVVIAIKDRLLADPTIADDEERAVLRDAVGVDLGTSAKGVGNLEGALRNACAVFLASPQFQFEGLSLPPLLGQEPPFVAPDTAFDDFCARIAALDAAVECGADTLTVR